MFIVDTHCDTLLAMADRNNEFIRGNALHVTPDKLRVGGVTLQVCALFAGSAGPEGQGEKAPAAMAKKELAQLPRLTGAGIRKVDSPLDAREGECQVMLSIEGGEIIGDSLETLQEYYEAGVRIFSLTWNHENLIAYPHCYEGQRGIKPFGWDVVRQLHRLGIAVDVAHLGEGGFWDLIFHGDKPPMTSHSCCRKLRGHTRNLTDDQIRALIEGGGWMGINFYTAFLTDAGVSTAETVVDHIAHVAELGGVKHVGFGSDFDGIDSAPVDVAGADQMPNLLDALARRGFTPEEIRGIAGENFLDYYRRIG